MSSEGGKVDVDMEVVRAVAMALPIVGTIGEIRAAFEKGAADLIRSHLEAERLRHVRETANVESTFNVLHLRAQQAEELCMAYERTAPGRRERLEVASRILAADIIATGYGTAHGATWNTGTVEDAVSKAHDLIAANEAYDKRDQGAT